MMANTNNTTLELQQDLARSSPRQCVTLTHSVPSVQMYYALRTKLETCTDIWLQEFLSLNGLDSLLDSLHEMAGNGFTCFSDAILLMDCISCVRCVLNTNLGLEHFISGDVYTKKLTMALNSDDSLPKKQVYEMLSAVCVYSNIGYLRVLEGLAYVKSECDQLHRFSVIVNDLQKSETSKFKMAVLTFVNALINCTPDVTERIRIRNEFIGLNLLDVLSCVRKEEPGEHLLLQLEVFHERKLSDEESVNANNNLDFNSPQDLLDQIQSRVFGTTRMVNFVNILQDLLAIETVYSENSGKLWQTIDTLTHHVVHTLTGRNLDSLHAEIGKLPGLFGQGLQCVSSYQEALAARVEAHNAKTEAKYSNADSRGTRNVKYKDYTQSECQKVDSSVNNPGTDCDANSSGSKSGSGNNATWNVDSWCHIDSLLAENGKSDSGSKSSAEMSSYDSCNSNSSGVHNRTVIVRRPLTGQNSTRPVIGQTGGRPFGDQNSPNEYDSSGNTCSISNGTDGYSTDSPSSNDRVEGASSSSHGDSSHSNQENATFDISDSMCGQNLNMDKDKSYNYNQNKVDRNKLNTFDKPCPPSLNFDIALGKNIPLDTWGVEKERKSSSEGTKMIDMDFDSKLPGCREKERLCRGKPANQVTRMTVPPPSRQMNPLKWVMLSDNRIVGREPCVWLPLEKRPQVDYRRLENTFQIKMSNRSDAVEEVVLLSVKTRLKINLFLHRLDSGAEDLAQNLEDGKTDQLSLPMLQYLSKIIPCPEEIEMLRQYTGPRLELGMAEQFVLLLSDQPDYDVLLEGHLVKAEFEATVRPCAASLRDMVALAKLVLNSPQLKQVLHMILGIGNYLNHGQYNGDSAGFKYVTLQRLDEVKSRIPCRNLLHHVVQVIEEGDKQMLTFVKELLALEKAASCSMEELKADISKLNGKLRFFMTKLANCTSTKLQSMFQPFIETLKQEFGCIQTCTTELRSLTGQLAEYFCEDETCFNLQDCFKCLMIFCKDIRKCQSESAFSQQPSQILGIKTGGDALQRRLKSKLISLEFGRNAMANSSMMEDRTPVLEKVLDQLHRGNYNPGVRLSALPSPGPGNQQALEVTGALPLEMSCIPYEGSPVPARYAPGTNQNDSVFLDTPELKSRDYCTTTDGHFIRSGTQRMVPVTTMCTAQTLKPYHQSTLIKNHNSPVKQNYVPSSSGRADLKESTKTHGHTGAVQKRLFAASGGDFYERNVDGINEKGVDVANLETRYNRQELKLKDNIERTNKRKSHCRSKSDLADALCVVNKWIEYEKMRHVDGRRAPIALPESACNLSTLNLENQGKFITNVDVAVFRSPTRSDEENVCNIEEGPIVHLPEDRAKKVDKKRTGGSFFSKIGRAVLKQRNVYSDGDQYNMKPSKDVRKKSLNLDKENAEIDHMVAADERLASREYKRYKAETNSNVVSRFFQRGGLYRSSKMKKKNQNVPSSQPTQEKFV